MITTYLTEKRKGGNRLFLSAHFWVSKFLRTAASAVCLMSKQKILEQSVIIMT